jgi:alpha-galactosidase
MNRIILFIAVCLAVNVSCKNGVPAGGQSSAAVNTILLEALDISKYASLTNIHPTPIDYDFRMNIATPRSYKGGIFLNGVQTLTESAIYIALDGKTLSFSADVGIDMKSPDATAEFFVIGDGQILWQSGVMKSADPERPVRVDLIGFKSLILKTTGSPANVYADWVNAFFTYAGEVPRTEWSPEIREIIRDTKAFMEEQNEKYPAPRINGAMKVGVRPNTPFYYPIAVTGRKPVSYQVEGLPKGLTVDLREGIISGTPVKRGEYDVHITASSKWGKAQRTLKIVVGDQLCLTPPMGYESWNWIEGHVSATSMKEMADAMVEFGFRDAGYQFIEIDDGWEGQRGTSGHITAHPYRFPDGMKTVGDYFHERGLKFGIYSSPGAITCAGYPGSLGFEQLDVDSWVSWGVDYLKHDHCSCPVEDDRSFELVRLVGELLKTSGRSIVMEASHNELGRRDAGNQYFRVGSDIRDTWINTQQCWGMGIMDAFYHAVEYADDQRPGRWIDPDMLIAGLYGTGRAAALCTEGKGCTDSEYRTQMSLWALMSSPLLISSDIRRVNRATLEILTNPEVIEVNQDLLGDFPERIGGAGDQEVWVKEMEDGSKTVALLNKAVRPAEITVRWSDLGLKGEHTVRDLWQRKDVGRFEKTYSATVASHEVVLVRIEEN